MDFSLLTPPVGGEDLFELVDGAIVARTGTGYNPDTVQYWFGSDAPRYAVAIQCHRDRGEYEKADAARDLAKSFGLNVGTARDRTVIRHNPKARSGYTFVEFNGVIFESHPKFKAANQPRLRG